MAKVKKMCIRDRPYGVDNRFEAEYASEHKTEDGGEESAAGDDGRQIRLLEPVKQKAAEQEAESLSLSLIHI